MKTDDSSNPLSRSAKQKAALSVALLTLAQLLAFPALAWFGYTQHGSVGIQSAAVAAGVCWVGATIALVLVGTMRGPQQAIQGVMLGILFATGIPLGLGLVLSSGDSPLAKANIFEMILFFYLYTLLIKTTLSVRLVRSMASLSKAS